MSERKPAVDPCVCPNTARVLIGASFTVVHLQNDILTQLMQLLCRASVEANLSQVELNDDIGDSVKHKLDVLGVGGAGKVSVDLFRVLPLVQVLKLTLDVRCCFLI